MGQNRLIQATRSHPEGTYVDQGPAFTRLPGERIYQPWAAAATPEQSIGVAYALVW
jgi:preprotein translocase subunit Sec63